MAKADSKKTATQVAPDPRKVRSVTKHVRIAPRKLRLVINTIRKRPAIEAVGMLSLMPQKGARIAIKTLKSAIANAKNLGLNERRLVVSDIRADGGPVMKRFISRSMGRANKILKRTSHLTVVVSEGRKIWGGESPEDVKSHKKKAAKVA
ncbi:MAG TPA: 50S ribosomal protein L22 [Candidatus Omnitrophota bacterium]|nr:50S ribosomal protein L22 [Candidatus Omnitrophota bacterium]